MSVILGQSVLRADPRTPIKVWLRAPYWPRTLSSGQSPQVATYFTLPPRRYGGQQHYKGQFTGKTSAVATPQSAVVMNLHKTGAAVAIATPQSQETSSSHRTGAAAATATPRSKAGISLHVTGNASATATPASVYKLSRKATGSISATATPAGIAARSFRKVGNVSALATPRGSASLHLHVTGAAGATATPNATWSGTLLLGRSGGRSGGPRDYEGHWPGLRSPSFIRKRQGGTRLTPAATGDTGTTRVVGTFNRDYRVSPSESGNVLVSDGGQELTFTLPPWQQGLTFEFVNNTTFAMTVRTQTDKLQSLGSLFTSATSPQFGSKIQVLATVSGTWLVENLEGSEWDME